MVGALGEKMSDINKKNPLPFNREVIEKLMAPIEALAENLTQLQQTVLTIDKGYSMMYEMMMENHKRLNRLEKEFLALEKKVNEKNNPR